MTEAARFDPILPAHAIERCGIVVSFAQPLPEKSLKRVVGNLEASAKRLGLVAAPQQAFAFTFDAQSGKILPAPEGVGPWVYLSNDRASQITLDAASVSWVTTRYVRWLPFIGQFEAVAGPFIAEYLESLTLKTVSLEYWDRFVWSGTWENFDVSRLLRLPCDLVSLRPTQSRREWHSHNGWFEQIDGLRRLVSMNVDVVEAMPAKPSVGIYSTMREEANVPGYGTSPAEALDMGFVADRLGVLHDALKKLLSETISDDMSARISLNSRASA